MAAAEDAGLGAAAAQRLLGAYVFTVDLAAAETDGWLAEGSGAPLVPPDHMGFRCLTSLSHSLLRAAEAPLAAAEDAAATVAAAAGPAAGEAAGAGSAALVSELIDELVSDTVKH